MKTLKNHIFEKLLINKDFKSIMTSMETRLLYLLGWDIEDEEFMNNPTDSAKCILDWVQKNNVKDFRIIVSKDICKSILQMNHLRNDIKSSDYHVINNVPFNDMVEKLTDELNEIYNSNIEIIYSNSSKLLFIDYTYSINNVTFKYIVESI